MSGGNGKGNIIRLVNKLIIDGLREGVDFINIIPTEESISVQYRVGDEVNSVAEHPLDLHLDIVARVKEMAGLKRDISANSQIGKMHIKLPHGKALDFSVRVEPSDRGEFVVIMMPRVMKGEN